MDYIAGDISVTEVILTGGDPLTSADRCMAAFTSQREAIPQIKRRRLHTRLPIVLPERVDASLLQWLGRTRLKVVVVVHTNHANEVDAVVTAALKALKVIGIELFNQSVLLRGVNDSADALADLSEALYEAGVMPYYLHLLDKVAGAAHFDVPEAEAKRLVEQLSGRLPGYLVPRLVREVAGAPAKLAV